MMTLEAFGMSPHESTDGRLRRNRFRIMDPELRGKRKCPPHSRSSPSTRRSRHSPNPQRSESPSTRLKPIRKLFETLNLYNSAQWTGEAYDENWYRSVLDAGRSDTLQEHRLAARLIRRMASKFPNLAEDTLSVLLNIATLRYHSRGRKENELIRETRLDTFHAFRSLLNSHPIPTRPISKLARFLLRLAAISSIFFEMEVL